MADVFKVYMKDCGLFVSMLEDGTQYDILQGNLYGYSLYGFFVKGILKPTGLVCRTHKLIELKFIKWLLDRYAVWKPYYIGNSSEFPI